MDGETPRTSSAVPPRRPIQAHDQCALAFMQTGAHLSHQSATLFITASRGFDRLPAPMSATRPALKHRRYTIDASVAPGAFPQLHDYSRYTYGSENEDFTPWAQPRATHLKFEQLSVRPRETDEPVHRRQQYPLPDPLRYRDLHRWGNVWPPFNIDPYVTVGNAKPTNEDFRLSIERKGSDCWWRDTILDSSLELILQYYNVEARGVGIATSVITMCLQFAQYEDANLNEVREYKAMFEDKKWIMIPLNDGIAATSAEETAGSHWALLAIDRPNHTAHYIDGWSVTRSSRSWQAIAIGFTCAMENLLSERYIRILQYDAPGQWEHNKSGGSDGGPCRDHGPCGPYVAKMVEYLVKRIIDHQDQGLEANINFDLDTDAVDYFEREFDSVETRCYLAYTLAGAKASQVANERAEHHDEEALRELSREEISASREPAPLLYDPALFSKTALTHKAVAKQYQRQQEAQFRSNWWSSTIASSSTSGSSGGIFLIGEANGIYDAGFQGNHYGVLNNEGQNGAIMNDETTFPALNGEVRIEEVSDDDLISLSSVDLAYCGRPATPLQPTVYHAQRSPPQSSNHRTRRSPTQPPTHPARRSPPPPSTSPVRRSSSLQSTHRVQRSPRQPATCRHARRSPRQNSLEGLAAAVALLENNEPQYQQRQEEPDEDERFRNFQDH
ncbi:hypothetical protein BU23DRAFT_558686 [Bimuria novae-zelandiae CBS 107.79]|uniref:Ubiquitin-like protease family profile domain-containing protein n=1 Tax=Bimuria novae-zelandiae CBS 107.79 TaxID=1447943 RepID=A0A6A5UUA9_9PLEO|nr:hypothetical protein BU23DRAFT_558686 [Bimuria novae-zelandiae CBS 107.79]